MKKKTGLIILFILFLAPACGGKVEENSVASPRKGTLFTGYVPGKKSVINSSSQEEKQIEEDHGIFFTVRNREMLIPPDETAVYEQNTFVVINGNIDIEDITYTINFTFIKSVSYPHSYNLISGRVHSQDDAVFFYQEAVSGGTVKTISKVKNGMLVIKKLNDNVVRGSFWARIGLDDGEDLYISNGKINLEKK